MVGLHCILCGLTDGKAEQDHYSSVDNSITFNDKYREHDKGPEEFCSILLKLMDADVEFVVSILGEHTRDIPGSVIVHRTYTCYIGW